MKIIFWALLAISSFLLMTNFGVHTLLIVAVISVSLYFYISSYIKKRKKLKAAKNQKEDIFIVSCHPETGQAPNLGELSKYCVFVPHNETIKAAKTMRQLLRDCGNKVFENKEMSTLSIMVIHILHREGVYAAQSWENFELRCISEISERLAFRHEGLLKRKPDYYYANQIEQSDKLSSGTVIEFT